MKTRSSAAGSHALNMYCTLCTLCSQLAAAAPCMCAAEHVVRKKPGLEEEEEEEGGGGGEGGEGVHSFLSYDAEMDEGVHTGQVMQGALAGLAIVTRDLVFLRPV